MIRDKLDESQVDDERQFNVQRRGCLVVQRKRRAKAFELFKLGW